MGPVFVFGDDRRSARFGLPAVLTLALLLAGMVAAVRWQRSAAAHRSAMQAAATQAAAHARTDRLQQLRDHYDRNEYNCSYTGLLSVSVVGRDPTPEEIAEAWRDINARTCTDEIASDPRRVLLPRSADWDDQAKKINAAVDNALCPTGTPCSEPYPKNPIDPRPLTDADVGAVRQALNAIGHPEAEVRPEQLGDSVPAQTVIYGIPLGSHACVVSYAAIGRHPSRLGAVGTLASGQCLRPAETVRPQPS